MPKLRIGYVPEHFSTPLFFAQQHFNLNADLVPFPTGTGALASALKDPDRAHGIDVAIGLTEGFIADLSRAPQSPGYGLVGTYVESPLCWAISTGAQRHDLSTVADLHGGARVGVSRLGSGSHVMAAVLAEQRGWGGPLAIEPIGDFAALRRAVGGGKQLEETHGQQQQQHSRADFFMWEHFTTKHFWDCGELKRLGEIYTPWPSWLVAARDALGDGEVRELARKINAGITHYRENWDEAVEYITTTMHYSVEDAGEWAKTVRFAHDVLGVSAEMVDGTIGVLQKAGVLGSDARGAEQIVAVKRGRAHGRAIKATVLTRLPSRAL